MKKIALPLLLSLAFAAPTLSGSVSGGLDLVSRYVWRGFDLLPDNRPALQPSLNIDLGKSGFSLGVWGSFALAKWAEYKGANEIDLTLTYAFKTSEKWEVTAGVTHYGYWFAEDFSFKDGTSQELFATVTRTDLPLSPSLSVYYDLSLGSGLYVTLGGGQELRISDKVGMEMGGLIAFNSRQYIDKTGFSDIDLFVKAPLALGRLTLTPSFNLMIPLMDEVNESVEFWFGLSAAVGGGE